MQRPTLVFVDRGCPSATDWVTRSFDLTPFAGRQTQFLAPGQEMGSAPGDFTVDFADVALVRADGTVVPIYTGGASNPFAAYLAYAPGDTTNRSFVAVSGGAAEAAVATRYFLDDHLGTTQVELAAGGWPLWQGQFTPFGAEIVNGAQLQPGADDGSGMPFKFTGKERDSESGNDYFGARYYGSTMGRFMSPDWSAKAEAVPYSELEFPQTLNLYQYMRNNPLSGADPDGHCDWCQKLWNGINGNGFQTNAQLADQKTLKGLENGTVTTSATYTPIVQKEPSSEPNRVVTLAADVASGVAAETGSAKLGGVAAGVSVVNDPSLPNITMNALSLVPAPVVGEGVAATTLVMDVGKIVGDYITDTILTPMMNSLPPQNIDDGSGHSIPNPALQDPTDPRP